MEVHATKHTKKNKSCSMGTHTYIPAVWSISSNKHVCDLFVCQHCMMPFNKSERETMTAFHRAITDDKSEN
jgi:hypothetical protein